MVRTAKRSGPSKFSSTRMTELLVAAEQTATLSPASRASSYSLMTPGRGSTSPLPTLLLHLEDQILGVCCRSNLPRVNSGELMTTVALAKWWLILSSRRCR